jgi:hypothetical protein
MIEDFIGVYDGYAPDDLCESAIEVIERVASSTPSELVLGAHQYPNGSISRKDESIFLQDVHAVLHDGLSSCLNPALEAYVEQYSILKPVRFRSVASKVQKTEVGGGYMDWHFESSSEVSALRVVVWTIYLNDMPEGEGETEFLYQHRRLRPKKGTVVLFPASYTHTHRGNPPLTTAKYIATGWYHLH